MRRWAARGVWIDCATVCVWCVMPGHFVSARRNATLLVQLWMTLKLLSTRRSVETVQAAVAVVRRRCTLCSLPLRLRSCSAVTS